MPNQPPLQQALTFTLVLVNPIINIMWHSKVVLDETHLDLLNRQHVWADIHNGDVCHSNTNTNRHDWLVVTPGRLNSTCIDRRNQNRGDVAAKSYFRGKKEMILKMLNSWSSIWRTWQVDSTTCYSTNLADKAVFMDRSNSYSLLLLCCVHTTATKTNYSQSFLMESGDSELQTDAQQWQPMLWWNCNASIIYTPFTSSTTTRRQCSWSVTFVARSVNMSSANVVILTQIDK